MLTRKVTLSDICENNFCTPVFEVKKLVKQCTVITIFLFLQNLWKNIAINGSRQSRVPRHLMTSKINHLANEISLRYQNCLACNLCVMIPQQGSASQPFSYFYSTLYELNKF